MVDILFEAPEVNLVALFGPEHGVRGNFGAGGHVDDAVDPKSDISGDDSEMETDEDDNVHVGGNGNGPWVCVPIEEHFEMSYQPGNFVQDPAPMNVQILMQLQLSTLIILQLT